MKTVLIILDGESNPERPLAWYFLGPHGRDFAAEAMSNLYLGFKVSSDDYEHFVTLYQHQQSCAPGSGLNVRNNPATRLTVSLVIPNIPPNRRTDIEGFLWGRMANFRLTFHAQDFQ